LFSSLLSLFALLFITATFTPAGDLHESDRERVLNMLVQTKDLIEQNYFDPGIKGAKLDAGADLARTRIQSANTIGEALAALAQFVLDLNDSHTLFIPPEQRMEANYGWKLAAVGKRVYVMQVDPKSDAARQAIAPGDEVIAINGLGLTRANLSRVQYIFTRLRPQPGLHIELQTPTGISREIDVAARVHNMGPILDYRRELEKLENLDRDATPVMADVGNQVVVARVPSFLVDVREMDEVLRRARGKQSLIIDLRGNGGGAVEALEALVGGLFPGDVTIAFTQERTKKSAMIARGSEGHAYPGRVFVLVDSRSASGSELLARTMQLTDRGTVIGDTTAGAVMEARFAVLPVSGRPVHFGVEVTVADVIMPDGQRLERVGVTPDFIVLPTAQDLSAGRDPVLDKALSFASTPIAGGVISAVKPN
jgi:C-terminal processing protease CtpA/Prc